MVVTEYDTLNTLSVMGLRVHESKNYVGWLNNRLRENKGTHVVTINAEMCMAAQTDDQLHRFIDNADLVAPDGSGIELYFRFMCGHLLRRYPGIELAADLLDSLGPEVKVAFYGGKPEVIDAAARAWQARAPQLNLAIVLDGYAKGDRLDDFIHRLSTLKPCGLGSAVALIFGRGKRRAPRCGCATHTLSGCTDFIRSPGAGAEC